LLRSVPFQNSDDTPEIKSGLALLTLDRFRSVISRPANGRYSTKAKVSIKWLPIECRDRTSKAPT